MLSGIYENQAKNISERILLILNKLTKKKELLKEII